MNKLFVLVCATALITGCTPGPDLEESCADVQAMQEGDCIAFLQACLDDGESFQQCEESLERATTPPGQFLPPVCATNHPNIQCTGWSVSTDGQVQLTIQNELSTDIQYFETSISSGSDTGTCGTPSITQGTQGTLSCSFSELQASEDKQTFQISARFNTPGTVERSDFELKTKVPFSYQG